jgi:hypothetical protein
MNRVDRSTDEASKLGVTQIGVFERPGGHFNWQYARRCGGCSYRNRPARRGCDVPEHIRIESGVGGEMAPEFV